MRKLRNRYNQIGVSPREALIVQIETAVLRMHYPNATPNKLRKLRALAMEKQVPIIGIPKAPSDSLDRIMASIIRHDLTGYDDMLDCGVSRDNARGLIQPMVRQGLERMKR